MVHLLLTPLRITGHWREKGLQSWSVFFVLFCLQNLNSALMMLAITDICTKRWSRYVDYACYYLNAHRKDIWMRKKSEKVGQCSQRYTTYTWRGSGCECCYKPNWKVCVEHLCLIVKKTNIFNDINKTDSVTVQFQRLFSVHQVTSVTLPVPAKPTGLETKPHLRNTSLTNHWPPDLGFSFKNL